MTFHIATEYGSTLDIYAGVYFASKKPYVSTRLYAAYDGSAEAHWDPQQALIIARELISAARRANPDIVTDVDYIQRNLDAALKANADLTEQTKKDKVSLAIYNRELEEVRKALCTRHGEYKKLAEDCNGKATAIAALNRQNVVLYQRLAQTERMVEGFEEQIARAVKGAGERNHEIAELKKQLAVARTERAEAMTELSIHERKHREDMATLRAQVNPQAVRENVAQRREAQIQEREEKAREEELRRELAQRDTQYRNAQESMKHLRVIAAYRLHLGTLAREQLGSDQWEANLSKVKAAFGGELKEALRWNQERKVEWNHGFPNFNYEYNGPPVHWPKFTDGSPQTAGVNDSQQSLPTRNGKPWMLWEDSVLRKWYVETQRPLESLAHLHQREPEAILYRLLKLDGWTNDKIKDWESRLGGQGRFLMWVKRTFFGSSPRTLSRRTAQLQVPW